MENREYRLGEYIPGYSGHIPKFNNTFGLQFTQASRSALQVPPVPARPVSAFIPSKSLRIVKSTYILPGNNFTGLAEPNEKEEAQGEDLSPLKYIQGSSVDLKSY